MSDFEKEIKIIAKCVGCGNKENASHHFGKEVPLCMKCGSPMIADTVKFPPKRKAKV